MRNRITMPALLLVFGVVLFLTFRAQAIDPADGSHTPAAADHLRP